MTASPSFEDQPFPPLPETTQFLDELIDERFAIAEALDPIAAHDYECSRYSGNLYTIPEALVDYVRADSTGAEVSLGFSRDTGSNFSVNKVRLELSDGPVVSVTTDGPFTIISQNDVPQEMFPGTTITEEVLRSLVPVSKQAAPAGKLALAIHQLSALSSHTMVVGDELNHFRYIQTETNSDTQDIISISRQIPHASGKKVQIVTTMQETLQKASKGVGGICDIVISTGNIDLTFEEITDGRSVTVARPTRLHTDAIRESIEALLEKTVPRLGRL